MNIGKLTKLLSISWSERGGGARIGPRENIGGLGAENLLSHAPFRIKEMAILGPLCESYSNS